MKSKQIIRSPTLRVQVAINAVKASCDSEPADLCGTMSRQREGVATLFKRTTLKLHDPHRGEGTVFVVLIIDSVVFC